MFHPSDGIGRNAAVTWEFASPFEPPDRRSRQTRSITNGLKAKQPNGHVSWRNQFHPLNVVRMR